MEGKKKTEMITQFLLFLFPYPVFTTQAMVIFYVRQGNKQRELIFFSTLCTVVRYRKASGTLSEISSRSLSRL